MTGPDSTPYWLGKTPKEVAEDHDPGLEPWCHWSREQLDEAKAASGDPAEHEFYHCFWLDTCSTEDLEAIRHAEALAVFLINEYGARGFRQCRYLARTAGRVAARVRKSLPADPHAFELN